jgi:peptidoglycan hydrolase-like protein with peptidoglycan-binding domain
VQERLAALGYLPPGAVTSVWDARTTHAVHAFQAWEGLARDGIVGPQTLAALEKATRPRRLAASATGASKYIAKRE